MFHVEHLGLFGKQRDRLKSRYETLPLVGQQGFRKAKLVARRELSGKIVQENGWGDFLSLCNFLALRQKQRSEQ